MEGPLCSRGFFIGGSMQLIYLSEKFYDAHREHREIMQKQGRPYACLSVQLYGHTFAIPLRHHIEHKYCFLTYDNCGLDYSKAVIVEEGDVGQGTPQIDQREFNAIKGKEHIIANGLRRYIALYLKASQRRDNAFYDNIRRYSALQYFENKLI